MSHATGTLSSRFLLRQQYGCLTLESHQRKGEKAYVGALRATKTALRLIKRERSLWPIATDRLETGNQTRRENTSRKKEGEKAAAPVASVKRDPGKIVRKVSFSNDSCFLLQNPSTAVRVSGPYSGRKKGHPRQQRKTPVTLWLGFTCDYMLFAGRVRHRNP